MDAPDHETVIHLNGPKSFKQVYLLYAKPLFRLSYSMLQDVQKSEEIVHTVFHSLWERRDTLVLHSSIKAYLVRAVQLKAMQYLRDKSNEQKHIALFSQQLARGQTIPSSGSNTSCSPTASKPSRPGYRAMPAAVRPQPQERHEQQ